MLIKLDDEWSTPRPCCHPERHPPSLIVLQPGSYMHICPGCGRETKFDVPGTDLGIKEERLGLVKEMEVEVECLTCGEKRVFKTDGRTMPPRCKCWPSVKEVIPVENKEGCNCGGPNGHLPGGILCRK